MRGSAHSRERVRRERRNVVGVGIMLAHNPLHGSGRAEFPHPALALGDDAHTAQGIGTTDGRRTQWLTIKTKTDHLGVTFEIETREVAMKFARMTFVAGLLTILWLAAAGCGGGSSASSPPPPVSISISPSTAIVSAGGTQQFQAQVLNTASTAVTWQVNGVTGGDAKTGTI